MLQVPELASAAGYFFKEGVEGKKLCPTVNYYAPMLYKMFVSFSGSSLSFSLAASSILLLCVLRILCMQVILLMATALNVCTPELSPNVLGNTLILDLRRRQQCIAEITEMIHVS